MERAHLRYKPKLSLEQARDKIITYGVFGDHHREPRPTDGREVAVLLLSLGLNPDELAEKCRDYRQPIPFLENRAGSTWFFCSSGRGKAGVVDRETGEVVSEAEGSGTITISGYQAHFETACKARDRAVEDSSYMDLQTAIVHGIASIESYVGDLARVWNRRTPNDRLSDSRQHKVSLDDKFDLWIPKMSGGGARLYKGDQRWSDFKKLRRLRDDYAVHPKLVGHAISYVELAGYINAFRQGMAGMLAQLHPPFGRPIPSVVINAAYIPDVEVVEGVRG
jgi:hypothetical protein